MDKLQPWFGNYFKLNQVYNALSSLGKNAIENKRIHELYITWAVAHFLQSQHNCEYAIGFPTYKDTTKTTLLQMISEGKIIDDVNFDTVIVKIKDILHPIRLQIKRFQQKTLADTQTLFNYIIKKTEAYGDSPELNIVFDIKSPVEYDINEFNELLSKMTFSVGSIWIYGVLGKSPKLRPFLLSVHPKFTGEFWMPTNMV